MSNLNLRSNELSESAALMNTLKARKLAINAKKDVENDITNFNTNIIVSLEKQLGIDNSRIVIDDDKLMLEKVYTIKLAGKTVLTTIGFNLRPINKIYSSKEIDELFHDIKLFSRISNKILLKNQSKKRPVLAAACTQKVQISARTKYSF